MIHFENNTSPFFLANKKYLDDVLKSLASFGTTCTGYCNSYGYEVLINFIQGPFTFYLQLKKEQSTQNGVVIPVNAKELSQVFLRVAGINKKFEITIGKSLFRRFFLSSFYKKNILKPYYIVSNYKLTLGFLNDLSLFIQEYRLSDLEMSNAVCTFHTFFPILKPVKMINDFHKILQSQESVI